MAIEQDKRRPAWMLPLVLLGLLLLGLLLFAFLRGDDDADGNEALASPLTTTEPGASPPGDPTIETTPDPATAVPTTNAPAVPTSTPTTTPTTGRSTPARDSDSALLAGGQPLLPLAAPNQDLTGRVGQPAQADGVVVQSVAADEGFWVGSSARDRVWVQFAQTARETDLMIEQGQRLTFQQAVVVAHGDDYANSVGVTAAEGAQQLSAHSAHVEVPREAVTIVDRP